MNFMKRITKTLVVLIALLPALHADDWPQWLGPQRDGVWRESGIVGSFATNGLPIKWRVSINAGYVGPAVVGQRLFMVDRVAGKAPERKRGDRSLPSIPGNERVVCLDVQTGKTLWEHAYDAAYRISYPAGPRATPVVADDRVFTLGAMGDLLCLRATNGQVVWSRSFLKDYTLDNPPAWGWAAHPVLDGPRLICLVGGSNSVVVAFDKDTGTEIWRALSAEEIGYAPPMIYKVGNRRHLIIWHPEAVTGLDPATGKVLWSQPYPVGGKPQRPEVTIATPRWDGRRLFVTSFYQGALLMEPSDNPPGVQVVWNRRSTRHSEMNDGLHTTLGTPIIRDGYIYGVCGFGEFRCLDLATGDRKWESYALTGGEKGLFANAFMVEQAGRFWVWNDHGELILAKLQPGGLNELSRTKLLDPVEHTRGRDVLWCHPAFANRCAYMHNGKELICVSLAAGA